MSKKKCLEEAYFHIDNGGITFRIVENTQQRDRVKYAPYKSGETKEDLLKRMTTPLGVEKLTNRRYYFEVRTSHFGSGVTFRFPLGNPHIVRWTIEALQRTLAWMEMPREEPTDGYEFALREGRMYIRRVEGREVDIRYPDSEQQKCSGSDGTSESHNQ